MSDAQHAHPLELLTFNVTDQEYSIDIIQVREIRGWTRTTPMPHAPDYMRGVINLRGTVLPVMDLARRLNLSSGETHERNVVIVVHLDGMLTGLLVDAVSDIVTVDADQLQPPPDIGAEQAGSVISALTLIDDRMIRVLNLAAVLPGESGGAAA